MAAADIMSAVLIPGLQRPFTKDDMIESSTIYNGLVRIQPEMQVDTDHVNNLVEIITRHGQLGKFSFHLVHRHDTIPQNTVRLESDLKVVPGKWNKATSIDSIDLSNIYPVVIKLIPEENRLVPYEFGKGPSPISATDVDGKFVKEFTNYLIENNLSDVFALEVVHPAKAGQSNECTAEIEVDKYGTIVLPKSMVANKEFLATGWPGSFQPHDSDPPAGQTWSKKTDGSHKVFINKTIVTAEVLINDLVRQGIIKV